MGKITWKEYAQTHSHALTHTPDVTCFNKLLLKIQLRAFFVVMPHLLLAVVLWKWIFSLAMLTVYVTGHIKISVFFLYATWKWQHPSFVVLVNIYTSFPKLHQRMLFPRWECSDMLHVWHALLRMRPQTIRKSTVKAVSYFQYEIASAAWIRPLSETVMWLPLLFHIELILRPIFLSKDIWKVCFSTGMKVRVILDYSRGVLHTHHSLNSCLYSNKRIANLMVYEI